MTPKYKLSKEWQLGCINTEKICFLPHSDLETDERERLIVTYPFANWILQGHLASHPILSSFVKDQVMIFCNFKPNYPSKYPSLDLIAFSHLGEVLIIESKRRTKSDGKSNLVALGKLKKAALQLSDYARAFVGLTSKFQGKAYTIWNDLHYNLYSRIHGFPSLYRTMKLCFSIDGIEQQRSFIESINQSISENRVHYGLAFNESQDHDLEYSIDVPGYSDVSRDLTCDMSPPGWDSQNGELMLFAVDHMKSKARIL
jgi:hypothetical protein